MQRPFARALLVAALPLALMTGVFLPTAHDVAAAGVSLSRANAAPGDTVTVSGSGFTPQDNAVVATTLNVSGNQSRVAAAVQVGGDGSFSASLTIPSGTRQDTYDVTAQDFHGHSAVKQLTILPRGYLAVGKNPQTIYVRGNHGFFAIGVGFKPNETVRLAASFPLYDGNSINIHRDVQASDKGTLPETMLSVPAGATAGHSDLTATGFTSHSKATVHLNVYYHPSITLESPYAEPGSTIKVFGTDFVPNSSVRVFVTIPRNGATTETLSKTAGAGNSGGLGVSITLPSNVLVGKYTIGAVDSVGNYKAYTQVQVTVHPAIAVKPATIVAGSSVVVSGSGFGSNVHLTVSATFPTQGGNSRNVTSGVGTGNGGGFITRIAVPADASTGTVTVTVTSSNGKATTQLKVQAAPQPTATAAATTTSTPAPAATPTPTPVPGQPPAPHKSKFSFRYISVWYHTVRVGTYNHLTVQSTLKAKLGAWIHVYFPSGLHLDYFENTDNHGKWSKQFSIPTNAISKYSSNTVITIRLWHGKKSIERTSGFALVH